jgi:hypothetical protein
MPVESRQEAVVPEESEVASSQPPSSVEAAEGEFGFEH